MDRTQTWYACSVKWSPPLGIQSTLSTIDKAQDAKMTKKMLQQIIVFWGPRDTWVKWAMIPNPADSDGLCKLSNSTWMAIVPVMAASPVFQSAGRRDLLFWEREERPTAAVVIWESLSEQEREIWLKEASTMNDWVVWSNNVRYRSWWNHLTLHAGFTKISLSQPNKFRLC